MGRNSNNYANTVRAAILLLLGLSCIWVGVADGVPTRSNKKATVERPVKEYLSATDVKIEGFDEGATCVTVIPTDRPRSAYKSYAVCDKVIVSYQKIVLDSSHSLTPEPQQ